MLTLLASHPPHPFPAQQCDSNIIDFNSKIKQAASNLSLHPFGLNTVQRASLMAPRLLWFVLQHEIKHWYTYLMKCLHAHVMSISMYLAVRYN